METEVKYANFGKWLLFDEAVYSNTAVSLGIANKPGVGQYTNMQLLYKNVYAPLCEHYKLKLPVSSFYRSPAVNKAVGGSLTSAHMNGQAIDIDCDNQPTGFPTNKELFEYVAKNMVFDQLILEAPDANNNPRWVHIAFRLHDNRGQKLRMTRVNGVSTYQTIS